MTWGLIGSRMQTKFNTQFSFQENLCLQIAFWPHFVRRYGRFFLLNSDTPKNFTLLDWTPIHRRYERTGIFGNINSEEVRRICKDERVNYESMRALWGSRTATSGFRLNWMKQMLTILSDTTDHMQQQMCFSEFNQDIQVWRPHNGRSCLLPTILGTILWCIRPRNTNGTKSRTLVAANKLNLLVVILCSDPEMLRNYGERILIFNMPNPATREVFSTVRENTNGYVLVSEPVSIDLIRSERRWKISRRFTNKDLAHLTTWSPVFEIQLLPLDDIICKIWGILLGGTPRFLKADTPADVQRSKEVRKDWNCWRRCRSDRTEEEDQGKGDA